MGSSYKIQDMMGWDGMILETRAPNLWKDGMITKILTCKLANERFSMFGISPAFIVYSYTVWDILVLVPDPKLTPVQIAFSIAHLVSVSRAD